MPILNEASIKRETLNIRIKPEERNLIDRAARTRGKNRTDFILDAARLAAEEALLDQIIIIAGAPAYAEFLARLDMPPAPNERLRKTMQTPAPWHARRSEGALIRRVCRVKTSICTKPSRFPD